jgi:hypothetical protein
MTSVEVRKKLVHAVGLDLVGPDREDTDLLGEVLPQAPSRWYITGFRVPTDAAEDDRCDDTADEGNEAQGNGGIDDNAAPEPAAARKAYFPSSMGMSLLVAKGAKELLVTVRWGDYLPDGVPDIKETLEPPLQGAAAGAEPPEARNLQFGRWRRIDRAEELTLTLKDVQKPDEVPVPNSNGLTIALAIRPVKDIPQYAESGLKGARSVSVFLVNRRVPRGSEVRDAAWTFQAALEVRTTVPFVPRPNLRGLDSNDWDERVADLQFRDACEYAVGHGISTCAVLDSAKECCEVQTRWLPSAEVERVDAAKIQNVELRMEELAAVPDAATAATKLMGLVTQYRVWIGNQAANVPAKPKPRRDTADQLLRDAGKAAERIEARIKLLADPLVLDAFKTANKVMALAARRRFGVMKGRKPEDVDAPSWRPFQLAFLLMNLEGVARPHNPDREVVDLLFFPTGGGKTEAYLGLAAFTLVYRRLTNPGIRGAGLSVLMRYTLRLLTLDQLGRAATLVCALELERMKNVDRLGEWPFEIGLWVGRGATPNEMGYKGHKDHENTARARTIAYQNNPKGKPSPIPLEDCPWCGAKFKPTSFTLVPNPDQPTDLRITCANSNCDFTRNTPLPILAVDEPVYRRLPCFLIATVDKFAAMPWTGPVGGFFGKVERYDKKMGFFGPCEQGRGLLIPGGALPPPDLVIQDELHLISGPMGTMVGLYEAALDELCCRDVDGKKVRPKIVASTATVRRAQNQIRALFCRRTVDIFPPPGPDRRDSFFARTLTVAESNARQYLGVAAQGVSPKKLLLRVYLALLAVAQKCFVANRGEKNPSNPADPYMTLLGYFGSLRELGGSRRIVEDEVVTKLTSYSDRKREGEVEGPFANRQISYEPVELTSRVSTSGVAVAKQRLARSFHEDDPVDVAIATNMISVGLDITRLGLMVVLGQPKTSAEYIQATSRVGRDQTKPGLVVTILNIHRPRDRSHYERFAYYHETFYRSVEATSVTPFSPRALDRGLAGALVAPTRQGSAPMTPAKGASEILKERGKLDWVAQALAKRAADVAESGLSEEMRLTVLERTRKLLDLWERIAKDYQDKDTTLQYQREEGAARPLLYVFLDPELKRIHPRHSAFRANRSMRDVEPSVNLWVLDSNGREVPEDSE